MTCLGDKQSVSKNCMKLLSKQNRGLERKLLCGVTCWDLYWKVGSVPLLRDVYC